MSRLVRRGACNRRGQESEAGGGLRRGPVAHIFEPDRARMYAGGSAGAQILDRHFGVQRISAVGGGNSRARAVMEIGKNLYHREHVGHRENNPRGTPRSTLTLWRFVPREELLPMTHSCLLRLDRAPSAARSNAGSAVRTFRRRRRRLGLLKQRAAAYARRDFRTARRWRAA